MKNKGRILTLVVELQGPEADWLWDTHVKGPINGLRVMKLSNDDKLEELKELEERHQDATYESWGEDN